MRILEKLCMLLQEAPKSRVTKLAMASIAHIAHITGGTKFAQVPGHH